MNSVNQTLYIPLYGKAYVSRLGIILHDPKAEEIWNREGFKLKGKSRSKWLAYYMAMRSAVFDRWLKEKMELQPNAAVVHIGCGMDSRILRVGQQNHIWFDLDFPEVICERRRYEESETYRMLGYDVTNLAWLEQMPKGQGLVLMEGVSMYLPPEELKRILAAICGHFEHVDLLMDCYTTFAARASKVKNPINDVGVTRVYGLDDPKEAEQSGFQFVAEQEMTPQDLIEELRSADKRIFKTLFAGAISRKLYRLYAYCGQSVRIP